MLRKHFTYFSYHLTEMESFWSEAGEHRAGCKTKHVEWGFLYICFNALIFPIIWWG